MIQSHISSWLLHKQQISIMPPLHHPLLGNCSSRPVAQQLCQHSPVVSFLNPLQFLFSWKLVQHFPCFEWSTFWLIRSAVFCANLTQSAHVKDACLQGKHTGKHLRRMTSKSSMPNCTLILREYSIPTPTYLYQRLFNRDSAHPTEKKHKITNNNKPFWGHSKTQAWVSSYVYLSTAI